MIKLLCSEDVWHPKRGAPLGNRNAVKTGRHTAALRDLRDGTNRTGLNPKEETLIRHIGFSGHNSPPVMIEMLCAPVITDVL